jgi:hypothetical protein
MGASFSSADMAVAEQFPRQRLPCGRVRGAAAGRTAMVRMAALEHRYR